MAKKHERNHHGGKQKWYLETSIKRGMQNHTEASQTTQISSLGVRLPWLRTKWWGRFTPAVCLAMNLSLWQEKQVTRSHLEQRIITIAVPKHPLGSMLLVEGVFSWDTNSSCKPKQSCSTDGAGMKKAACAAFVAANQNTRRLFLPSVTPTDEWDLPSALFSTAPLASRCVLCVTLAVYDGVECMHLQAIHFFIWFGF